MASAPTSAELFATCDYVSMHLPLTPETEGLVNEGILGQAKDGIVVVNTGRGKTVDAEAMVAALESARSPATPPMSGPATRRRTTIRS